MKSLRTKFILFISASVLFHFFGMTFVYFSPSTPEKTLENVEVEFLDHKPEADKQIQIVDQDKKRINEETPDKKYFLSRHDQVVKNQTRAKNFGKLKNTAGQDTFGTQSKSKSLSKKVDKVRAKGLNKFTPSFDYTKSNIAQNSQASQTDDHLKDIKDGGQTLLSTREFTYFSYYSRIKDKIRQYWGPKVREKISNLLRSGRTIASTQSRTTRIIIVLNKSGTLETVKVFSKSGVRDLDEAAIEAFREAAPFPNPPKGLLEKDGKVRIHWDFILEA